MDASQQDMIDKCRAFLKKEGIIKSALWGGVVGLSAGFIIAFVTWFVEFKGLWLSIGVGLGLWAVAAVPFYFLKFRPTDIDVMRRLDRAGLEERMITMHELKDDNSFMASVQRKDAQKSLDAAVANTGGKLLHIKIATVTIVVACIVFGCAVGMTVVTGLSDYGVIRIGSVVWDDTFNPVKPVYFNVNFIAKGFDKNQKESNGGDISGEREQTVEKGSAASAVRAVPNAMQGYYLKYWEDDLGNRFYGSPLFVAENVQRNITVTAVFEQLIDEDIFWGYYYDPNGEEEGGGGGDGEGGGGDSENSGPPGDQMPGLGNGAGGSATEPGDTIIDGETQYDELYEKYYELAMEMLANGTDGYPPELVEMLEAYFGILRK